MQAKIKKTEVFDFEINGATYEGFKKESEWEGFVKYRNKQGEIIVMSDPRPVELMNQFLNKNEPDEVRIIKCSTCFLQGKDS